LAHRVGAPNWRTKLARAEISLGKKVQVKISRASPSLLLHSTSPPLYLATDGLKKPTIDL
jgi:hypothetical protein